MQPLSLLAFARIGLTGLLGLAATTAVFATDQIWIGTGSDTDWATAGNWDSAVPADSTGADVAIFGLAAGDHRTLSLSTSRSVKGVVLNEGGFSFGSLSGATLTAAGFGTTATAAVVNNAGDNTIDFNMALTTGAGNLYLLHVAAGKLTVGPSGSLNLNGLFTSTSSSPVASNLNVDAGATLTMKGAIVANNISRTNARLSKVGPGTWRVESGGNDLSDLHSISLQEGTIELAATNALGTTTFGNSPGGVLSRTLLLTVPGVIFNNPITYIINTPQAAANNITFTIGGSNTSGVTEFAASIALSNAGLAAGYHATKITAAAGGTVVFSGTIADAHATQVHRFGSIDKIGEGTVIFEGANTYTEGTTVSAGTLLVNNTSGSGTGKGAVSVKPGAVLGGIGILEPVAGNNVTIAGTLRPGDEIATLTLNLSGSSSLVFDPGAIIDFTPASSSEAIHFTTPGAWLSGAGNATLRLRLADGFDYGATYTLFDNVTTPDFTLAGIEGHDTNSYAAQLAFNAEHNCYQLSFTSANPQPPTITTQPESQTAMTGGTVSFTVVASGTPAPTYQWSKNAIPIEGATAATLTLANLTIADAGSYTVVVTNSHGTVTSSTATLNIIEVVAPAITSAPASRTVNAGTSTTFTVEAVGTEPFTYQWKKDGAVIEGAHTATLTLSNVQKAGEGSYTVSVANTAGTANSEAIPAILTVTDVPPTLTTQPASQSVFEGATVTFTVSARGTELLSYQWSKDGASLVDGGRIAGASSATLTISSAQIDVDAGSYRVVVSNPVGNETSAAATLTVNAVPLPPVAPAPLAATKITNTGFTANWSSVSNATAYQLDLSTNSAFSSFVSGYENLDVGAALSWGVTGLNESTTYFYRVRATNSVGTSASSSTMTVVTVETPVPPAITSAAGAVFTVGAPGSFIVTATGTPTPTFSASGLPDWATLANDTGLLSGTAPDSAAGAQIAVTITAQNGTTPDATQAFTLTVQARPVIAAPLLVSTLAGEAGAPGATDAAGAAARFNQLTAVAMDGAGNAYVADTDNHTIRKVTPAGMVTTLAGNPGISGHDDGTGTSATFNFPSAVAIDTAGNVYVADTMNHTIRMVSPAGEVSTFAGLAENSGSANGTAADARFFGPQGVALNSAGTLLYIADTNNHAIRQIALSTGTVTTLAGLAGHSGSADGTGTAARFNAPVGVTVDKNGKLYVADTESNAIRAVTSAGAVTTLAGQSGSGGAADGTGSAARFNQPSAVAVDAFLNVYVLDTDNHTVRKITSTGVVTTLAGLAGTTGSDDGLGNVARFNHPEGLAIDAGGALYIADTGNHTLRQARSTAALTIIEQPKSVSLSAGATATFTVATTGQPAPTYQWYFNGATIPGATNATYSQQNIQQANVGDYTVVVSNALGSVTSGVATLSLQKEGAPSSGGGAPSGWFYMALSFLAAVRWALRRKSPR